MQCIQFELLFLLLCVIELITWLVYDSFRAKISVNCLCKMTLLLSISRLNVHAVRWEKLHKASSSVVSVNLIIGIKQRTHYSKAWYQLIYRNWCCCCKNFFKNIHIVDVANKWLIIFEGTVNFSVHGFLRLLHNNYVVMHRLNWISCCQVSQWCR